jgi:7-carboxy-7-deazaguanine synthase
MLQITEIFKSVQGESSFAGLPCVFVRLTGCNLRCQYCDTEYAFYGGKAMTIKETINVVDKFGLQLVEITGGEPLLQAESLDLMKRFLDLGFKVLLETGGSISIQDVPDEVIKIVDMKCPSSGEMDKNDLDNLSRLARHDEVKFVIGNRDDYEWSRGILEEYKLQEKANTLFSPVFEVLSLRSLAEWILEDNLSVRLQTQLHKHIWDKHATGV